MIWSRTVQDFIIPPRMTHDFECMDCFWIFHNLIFSDPSLPQVIVTEESERVDEEAYFTSLCAKDPEV